MKSITRRRIVALAATFSLMGGGAAVLAPGASAATAPGHCTISGNDVNTNVFYTASTGGTVNVTRIDMSSEIPLGYGSDSAHLGNTGDTAADWKSYPNGHDGSSWAYDGHSNGLWKYHLSSTQAWNYIDRLDIRPWKTAAWNVGPLSSCDQGGVISYRW